jgi:hypothetical protein
MLIASTADKPTAWIILPGFRTNTSLTTPCHSPLNYSASSTATHSLNVHDNSFVILMGSKKRSRPISKVVETALDKAKDIKPEEAKADDNNTEPENASNTKAETSSIKEGSVKGKGPDTAASIHASIENGCVATSN